VEIHSGKISAKIVNVGGLTSSQVDKVDRVDKVDKVDRVSKLRLKK
jgi:hypothetical protein